MSGSPPFIDRESRELDLNQIYNEALPIAALVVLFGGLALLVFLIVIVISGGSALGGILTILTQFILAIGAGVTLLYVIARGIQLADA